MAGSQASRTWGLRIEYTSIGADADISYWKIPARLDFGDFLGKDEVPLSSEEWEGLLNNIKSGVFPSKTEYLETLSASQHLNFNLRVSQTAPAADPCSSNLGRTSPNSVEATFAGRPHQTGNSPRKL